MEFYDTIAAIATAPGQGGIAIVRLSGRDAEQILMKLFRPAGGKQPLTSHMLTYGTVFTGEEVLDHCMAVLMRAPRSYTREDVAELQLHGGSYTAAAVLEQCLACGARLAQPGEFTRRAFLNGRIDLSQAEAVMSLIAANGEQAHKAAIRELEGGASSFIRKGLGELLDMAAGAAACIDYPEEISEEEAAGDLLPRLNALAKELEAACNERAARILRSGLQVALCGSPNVGKSSLLNALMGEERAIVTAIPGTTRDTVEGTVMLGGCEICLTDTAGLRETQDLVEQIGVGRSQRAMQEADVVLLVLDSSRTMTAEERQMLQDARQKDTLVLLNKTDLPAVITEEELRPLLGDMPLLSLSAQQPDTLRVLKEELQRRAMVTDRLTLTQPRQIAAARRAAEAIRSAAAALEAGMPVDLCTVDLQAAAQALGEITGDAVDERLLDRVFEQFCVGK